MPAHLRLVPRQHYRAQEKVNTIQTEQETLQLIEVTYNINTIVNNRSSVVSLCVCVSLSLSSCIVISKPAKHCYGEVCMFVTEDEAVILI